MIPCKHCNTPNSLDSTFCKRCGTGLPEDEIIAAKSKLEKIVEEGFHALNSGKIEEAMAIAETAVTSDPSMVSAYSLKSNAHERKGEIAEALESAERLVELNPDSELDKIKRNQLRAALGASAMQYRPPSKAVAAVAALSAAAIVLCGAVWTAKLITQKPYDSRVAYNTPIKPEIQNPLSGQTQPYVNPQTQNSAPAQNPNPGAPAAQSNLTKGPAPVDGNDAGSNSDESEAPPTRKGTTLPSSNEADLSVSPIVPTNLPPNLSSTGTAGGTPATHAEKSSSVDPTPTPESSNKTAVQPVTPPDPGEVDIRIHDGSGGRSHSSSQGAGRDNPGASSKIFMKMGNDFYQMGNYSGAAASLEKAVSNGADPVVANHRLAQSYNSLGKRAEAVEAYKRTIAACTESLNAGRGNSAKVRAVRDASEAALRQLQGG